MIFSEGRTYKYRATVTEQMQRNITILSKETNYIGTSSIQGKTSRNIAANTRLSEREKKT